MRLPETPWSIFDELDSTQTRAAETGGIVLAGTQTAGRGRHGRSWLSAPGDSLCLSLAMPDYRGHSRPWLLGMALACAAAGAMHCQVQWPNDLCWAGQKLGGILTEIIDGVPVLGIGVNLNQTSFPPEIARRAVSLGQVRQGPFEAKTVAEQILRRFAAMPDVDDWADLLPIWNLYDATAGKRFQLPNGEEAVAVGIGPHGELLCTVKGEAQTVLAADALMPSAAV